MATDEWKSVGPVVEGLKAMLLQQARSLVTSANRRPMLYCNGADGTPIRLTGTFMSSFDGNIVERRGGDGQELLIQRGYIVTRDGIGELTSAAIVRDFVPLSAGKGSSNCFTAATICSHT